MRVDIYSYHTLIGEFYSHSHNHSHQPYLYQPAVFIVHARQLLKIKHIEQGADQESSHGAYSRTLDVQHGYTGKAIVKDYLKYAGYNQVAHGYLRVSYTLQPGTGKLKGGQYNTGKSQWFQRQASFRGGIK